MLAAARGVTSSRYSGMGHFFLQFAGCAAGGTAGGTAGCGVVLHLYLRSAMHRVFADLGFMSS